MPVCFFKGHFCLHLVSKKETTPPPPPHLGSTSPVPCSSSHLQILRRGRRSRLRQPHIYRYRSRVPWSPLKSIRPRRAVPLQQPRRPWLPSQSPQPLVATAASSSKNSRILPLQILITSDHPNQNFSKSPLPFKPLPEFLTNPFGPCDLLDKESPLLLKPHSNGLSFDTSRKHAKRDSSSGRLLESGDMERFAMCRNWQFGSDNPCKCPH
ncbi:unnamed protein product [Coffea canephora]|uniref:Uncharacterized protein n=1 Tax=Coffea canephora TaxID=49390 RepID=A0A068V3G2_COFCA|nr:unnamed protein product [Coffea canephora]